MGSLHLYCVYFHSKECYKIFYVSTCRSNLFFKMIEFHFFCFFILYPIYQLSWYSFLPVKLLMLQSRFLYIHIRSPSIFICIDFIWLDHWVKKISHLNFILTHFAEFFSISFLPNLISSTVLIILKFSFLFVKH